MAKKSTSEPIYTRPYDIENLHFVVLFDAFMDPARFARITKDVQLNLDLSNYGDLILALRPEFTEFKRVMSYKSGEQWVFHGPKFKRVNDATDYLDPSRRDKVIFRHKIGDESGHDFGEAYFFAEGWGFFKPGRVFFRHHLDPHAEHEEEDVDIALADAVRDATGRELLTNHYIANRILLATDKPELRSSLMQVINAFVTPEPHDYFTVYLPFAQDNVRFDTKVAIPDRFGDQMAMTLTRVITAFLDTERVNVSEVRAGDSLYLDDVRFKQASITFSFADVPLMNGREQLAYRQELDDLFVGEGGLAAVMGAGA